MNEEEQRMKEEVPVQYVYANNWFAIGVATIISAIVAVATTQHFNKQDIREKEIEAGEGEYYWDNHLNKQYRQIPHKCEDKCWYGRFGYHPKGPFIYATNNSTFSQ